MGKLLDITCDVISPNDPGWEWIKDMAELSGDAEANIRGTLDNAVNHGKMHGPVIIGLTTHNVQENGNPTLMTVAGEKATVALFNYLTAQELNYPVYVTTTGGWEDGNKSKQPVAQLVGEHLVNLGIPSESILIESTLLKPPFARELSQEIQAQYLMAGKIGKSIGKKSLLLPLVTIAHKGRYLGCRKHAIEGNSHDEIFGDTVIFPYDKVVTFEGLSAFFGGIRIPWNWHGEWDKSKVKLFDDDLAQTYDDLLNVGLKPKEAVEYMYQIGLIIPPDLMTQIDKIAGWERLKKVLLNFPELYDFMATNNKLSWIKERITYRP